MHEEKYSAIAAELDALLGSMKEKTEEHSRLLKEAERHDWDSEIMARAQVALERRQELSRQFDKVLESADDLLRQEGLDPALFERTEHLDRAPRWWKCDLLPAAVEPTGDDIEECLERGLETLQAYVPQGWWKEQSVLCDAIGEDHFLSPLVLYGWHDCRPLPGNVHRYAYALRQAEIHLRGGGTYDVYNGAALVPVIAGLCRLLDLLTKVKNGIRKLEEIPTSPSEETDSRIYELLVAARMVGLGRSVELLPTQQMKTPDIRIYDMAFPAVAECKRQSRLSAYEKEEVDHVAELFSLLLQRRTERGLVGELILEFKAPVSSVAPAQIAETILKHGNRIDPRFADDCDWGTVSFRPMEPSLMLPRATRLYGPEFLKHAFAWPDQDHEFDGICAVVANARRLEVGRAELPFCLKWRQMDPHCIDRKARSIVSLLKEAWEQIPTGEAGFIYVAFEDSLPPSVADRRTKRVVELARTLYFKDRHALPMRIVVNRVYPQPINHGQPDLIESSIPMSIEPEDNLASFLPTCVYTAD